MTPNPQTSYFLQLTSKKALTHEDWQTIMDKITKDPLLSMFARDYESPMSDKSIEPIHTARLITKYGSIQRDDDIQPALVAFSKNNPEITVYVQQYCEEPWEPDEEYTIKEGNVLKPRKSSIIDAGMATNEPSRKAIEWYLRNKGFTEAANAVHLMDKDLDSPTWNGYNP